MSHPIAVVGSGLSGIFASAPLSEARHNVLLIEAREHIGGRVLSEAKFIAVYDTVFLRNAGLSGTAMSQRGPLLEIQDASNEYKQTPALFGFVGTASSYRAGIGE